MGATSPIYSKSGLAVVETEIKNLEARKKSSLIEITPEALAVVIAAWRADLLEAKQNNNVAALRALLARFISRIEVGDHQVSIWYAFPIERDDPIGRTSIRRNITFSVPGHQQKRSEA